MSIKAQLVEILAKNIGYQIDSLRKTMADVQSSANEETKSSAGDKYETGRAMAQLEVDKLKSQLLQAEESLRTLNSILPENQMTIVGFGSLIYTNTINFFISVPMKAVELDSLCWQPVSSAAPVAKVLIGRKTGDFIDFQGKSIHIQRVE